MARKQFLLRIDPELWKELEKWAADDLRSVNAQVGWLLREAVRRRKGGRARQERPRHEDEHEDGHADGCAPQRSAGSVSEALSGQPAMMIAIVDLRKTYGRTVAVDDLSFSCLERTAMDGCPVLSATGRGNLHY